MKKDLSLYLTIALICAGSFVIAQEKWESLDIGTEGGKTRIEKDSIVIIADGADIWETADGFRFVYRKVSGNVEISARIHSLKEVNEWSKAGVMIRESTKPGSKHVMLVATPMHGLAFQYRPEADDTSQHVEVGEFEYPVYLKMKRTGNAFSAYWSRDGRKWNEAGEIEVEMGKDVLAGLAVTSHAEGEYTEAKFTEVKLK